MLIKKIENTYSLGKMNRLEVLRFMPQGAYLKISDSDEDSDNSVLLPSRYVPKGCSIGDILDVFLYYDNEGRLTATTLKPLAEVGDTKYLKCVNCSSAGAFLYWGIHKDIFVPFAEQYEKMIEGNSYNVHIYIDKISGKIVASSKLNKHIGNLFPEFDVSEKVRSLVVDRNDFGFRVVVNNIYWGILYFDELDSPLHIGEEYDSYVVRIREDGKIDLSIKPVGYSKVELLEKGLLDLLKENNGVLPIGDKSNPEKIKEITGMSKKAFKMLVGSLYKKDIVLPFPNQLKLKK